MMVKCKICGEAKVAKCGYCDDLFCEDCMGNHIHPRKQREFPFGEDLED